VTSSLRSNSGLFTRINAMSNHSRSKKMPRMTKCHYCLPNLQFPEVKPCISSTLSPLICTMTISQLSFLATTDPMNVSSLLRHFAVILSRLYFSQLPCAHVISNSGSTVNAVNVPFRFGLLASSTYNLQINGLSES
jgi:hypothetical protein